MKAKATGRNEGWGRESRNGERERERERERRVDRQTHIEIDSLVDRNLEESNLEKVLGVSTSISVWQHIQLPEQIRQR